MGGQRRLSPLRPAFCSVSSHCSHRPRGAWANGEDTALELERAKCMESKRNRGRHKFEILKDSTDLLDSYE